MEEKRNEENVMQECGQPLDTSREVKPLWPVVAIVVSFALTVTLVAVIVKRKN